LNAEDAEITKRGAERGMGPEEKMASDLVFWGFLCVAL
jgi:hypothetical protein